MSQTDKLTVYGLLIKLRQIPTLKVKAKKFTKWSTLWDIFDFSVHSNPALLDVKRFSYLLSLLESSAAEVVGGLALTAANYEEAIITQRDDLATSTFL